MNTNQRNIELTSTVHAVRDHDELPESNSMIELDMLQLSQVGGGMVGHHIQPDPTKR